MKTLAIDCRFAAARAGLGRYTREIVTHLAPLLSDVRIQLIVRDTNEEWLTPLLSPTVEAHVLDAAHYSIAEQTKLPALLKKLSPDLFFSPHFNVPLRCPVPFVATVHDLILHRYPNQASRLKQWAYRLVMGHAVKDARKLIAVSAFTKQELVAVYGEVIAAKTETVTEGISPLFTRVPEKACETVLKRHALHKPFFLYVGNAKEHKNVQTLIHAFGQAKLLDHELILMTHGPEVVRLKFTDRVRVLHDVPDEELPALYSSAKAFVTASLYEGFCLPVVEAQACGCPVIAANTSAIPEVASPATLLVEPTVDAFTAAFLQPPQAMVNPLLPSWNDAATATAKLLRDLL